MQNPGTAAAKVPRSAAAGQAVFKALLTVLDSHQQLVSDIVGLIHGQPMNGVPEQAVTAARAQVGKALSLPLSPHPPQGICPQALEAWQRAAADPDTALPRWATEGAPLGINKDIERCGVFPPIFEAREDHTSAGRTFHPGWTNYRSAEEDPAICQGILQNMVNKEWAICCEALEAVASTVETIDFVVSRMALLTKTRADGTLKHRIIWDFRRSFVNSRIRQAERIMLPRALDASADALELWRSSPQHGIIFFGCDVEAAFHQVPVHRSEWRYQVTYLDGRWYVFKVLVFGAASAPTIWGRVAALAARSLAAILPQRHIRHQIYVDDPFFVAQGPPPQAARLFAVALLWFLVLGLPIAPTKLEAGHSLTWIGVHYAKGPACIELSLQADKILELMDTTTHISTRSVVSIAEVRSFAGKLSFFAGIVPALRPALWPLWAVLAPSRPDGANEAAVSLGLLSSAGGRKRGGYWIHVRRLRRCLAWLAAFWAHRCGTLVRRLPLHEPQPEYIISTDASPWGIGAILQSTSGKVIAYFADNLTAEDEKHLHAHIGLPDFQSIWELLAIVVALRAWKHLLTFTGVFRIRADSMVALAALHKNSSSAAALNKLLLLLSLHEVDLVGGLRFLEHVPGAANILPDLLSRLSAPGSEGLPSALRGVHRTAVHRDPAFWLLGP